MKKAIPILLATCPLFMFAASPVQAQEFSNSDLNGVYVVQSSGTLNGVTSHALGRAVLDGEGGCTVAGHVIVNGTAVAADSELPGGSCNYSVNEDGSGDSEVIFVGEGGLTLPFSINFVIVTPEEVRILGTDPTMISAYAGTVTRQGR